MSDFSEIAAEADERDAKRTSRERFMLIQQRAVERMVQRVLLTGLDAPAGTQNLFDADGAD